MRYRTQDTGREEIGLMLFEMQAFCVCSDSTVQYSTAQHLTAFGRAWDVQACPASPQAGGTGGECGRRHTRLMRYIDDVSTTGNERRNEGQERKHGDSLGLGIVISPVP